MDQTKVNSLPPSVGALVSLLRGLPPEVVKESMLVAARNFIRVNIGKQVLAIGQAADALGGDALVPEVHSATIEELSAMLGALILPADQSYNKYVAQVEDERLITKITVEVFEKSKS